VSGNGRSQADAILVSALLGGLTIAEAARQAGVSERTARRRLRDPDFAGELAAAKAELLDRTLTLLADASTQAVMTLRELLGKDAPPQVRAMAGKTLLELTLRRRELGGVSSAELSRVVGAIVGEAITHMPEEEEARFIRAVQNVVAGS
jgi:hypothetical protein